MLQVLSQTKQKDKIFPFHANLAFESWGSTLPGTSRITIYLNIIVLLLNIVLELHFLPFGSLWEN